jgi:hypothetical protein
LSQRRGVRDTPTGLAILTGNASTKQEQRILAKAEVKGRDGQHESRRAIQCRHRVTARISSAPEPWALTRTPGREGKLRPRRPFEIRTPRIETTHFRFLPERYTERRGRVGRTEPIGQLPSRQLTTRYAPKFKRSAGRLDGGARSLRGNPAQNAIHSGQEEEGLNKV